MLAEDDSSSEESESGSDSSDDDLELLLLQNIFTPRELGAHVNYQQQQQQLYLHPELK